MKARTQIQGLAARGFIAGSSCHDELTAVNSIHKKIAFVPIRVFDGVSRFVFIATRTGSVTEKVVFGSEMALFVTAAPVSAADAPLSGTDVIVSITERIQSGPGRIHSVSDRMLSVNGTKARTSMTWPSCMPDRIPSATERIQFKTDRIHSRTERTQSGADGVRSATGRTHSRTDVILSVMDMIHSVAAAVLPVPGRIHFVTDTIRSVTNRIHFVADMIQSAEETLISLVRRSLCTRTFQPLNRKEKHDSRNPNTIRLCQPQRSADSVPT